MKLLDLAMLIAAVEEARPLAVVAEAVPAEAPWKKTEIRKIDNLRLQRGASRYIYSSGRRGTLYEAVIITDSPSFKIILNVDGIPMLDASWNEINSITQELVDVTAFQRMTGDYALRIANVSWIKSSHLLLVATDAITINKAIAKYEEVAP